MAEGKVNVSGGISFGGLLALLFITLKLTGVIAWSWWWVLAPLWIPGGIALAILIIVVVAVGIVYVLKAL